MAINYQLVDVGTAPNDGTGDTIRDAMIKFNANFQAMLETQGRGQYTDGTRTSAAPLIVSTTEIKLPNDASTTNVTTTSEPGVSTYWDIANSKFDNLTQGGIYALTILFSMRPNLGASQDAYMLLELKLDEGDIATDTSIASATVTFTRGDTVGFRQTYAFPINIGSGVATNGVYVSAKMSAVSCDIYDIEMQVDRLR